MAGWGWVRVHHPDHVDRVTRTISHAFEHGEAWEDLFPLRGTDGETVELDEVKRGAKVHDSSEVFEWTHDAGMHHLNTPGGILRAKKVPEQSWGRPSSL